MNILMKRKEKKSTLMSKSDSKKLKPVQLEVFQEFLWSILYNASEIKKKYKTISIQIEKQHTWFRKKLHTRVLKASWLKEPANFMAMARQHPAIILTYVWLKWNKRKHAKDGTRCSNNLQQGTDSPTIFPEGKLNKGNANGPQCVSKSTYLTVSKSISTFSFISLEFSLKA